MTVIEMHPAQLAAVAEIERQCFHAPWSEQDLKDELDAGGHIFLAAAEGEDVLGYVGCQVVLDEGYVTNVAVLPGHRRKGIAQQLIEQLLAAGRRRGLRIITLEVRQSNEAAVRLYEKNGFEAVGLRKNFYRQPVEAAVLMTYHFEKVTEDGA